MTGQVNKHGDDMSYTEQADKFLADAGLEFRAVLVGDDCPMFCEDNRNGVDMDKLNTFPRKTHIHGKHYRCTISKKDRGHFTIDFWNSYSDEEFNFVRRDVPYISPGSHPQTVALVNRYGGRVKIKAQKLRKPTPYDVLACITKSDPGTFEDFCADYGYDEDSRRAENVYHSVVTEWRKVRKFFTSEEIEVLQDIQ